MSIFGDIAAAIFGTDTANAAPAAGAKANADVIKILEQRDETSKEDLDWKESIVDLLKLLNLDSSLTARKALADELKYPGDKNDSAAMNMWLHKQVMTKLAENGGVVPQDLQH
jgi:glycine/serine hydroxymethyltransferase